MARATNAAKPAGALNRQSDDHIKTNSYILRDLESRRESAILFGIICRPLQMVTYNYFDQQFAVQPYIILSLFFLYIFV